MSLDFQPVKTEIGLNYVHSCLIGLHHIQPCIKSICLKSADLIIFWVKSKFFLALWYFNMIGMCKICDLSKSNRG